MEEIKRLLMSFALTVTALLVPLRNGPYIKCHQQSNQLTLITESKPIIVELRRIPKSFFKIHKARSELVEKKIMDKSYSKLIIITYQSKSSQICKSTKCQNNDKTTQVIPRSWNSCKRQS